MSLSRETVRWHGRTLDLYGGRAVLWRRERTLIIADPHFGKAAAFRHHGIPVPEGPTTADLDRLASLVTVSNAKRLIVLGDFFHHRTGRAPATLAVLGGWRQRFARLEIVLVRGNHDMHAGDPPSEWRFHCCDEPFLDGPFAFCHMPEAKRPPSHPAFVGHIHPCALLYANDGATIRAACFWVSPDSLALPAFGTFTGNHPIRPRTGDRVFAVSPNSVVEVKCRLRRK